MQGPVDLEFEKDLRASLDVIARTLDCDTSIVLGFMRVNHKADISQPTSLSKWFSDEQVDQIIRMKGVCLDFRDWLSSIAVGRSRQAINLINLNFTNYILTTVVWTPTHEYILSGRVRTVDEIDAFYKEITEGISTVKKPDSKHHEIKEAPKSALRYNEGKTPYAHLPLDLLAGAAGVMAYGAKKYHVNNYRAGYEDILSPLQSLLRHVVAAQEAIVELSVNPECESAKAKLMDAESGFSHLDHTITSALLMIQTLKIKGIIK